MQVRPPTLPFQDPIVIFSLSDNTLLIPHAFPGTRNPFLTVTLGASTVKYTTPLPWIGLRGSDSKLCTNLEFCERKNN